jgi:hypothetical protein
MPLQYNFDVVVERDEEGYYLASVPQLPGCHTQARSLDEVTPRIREAIEIVPRSAGPTRAQPRIHRHPAHHDRGMSRTPRISGSELVTVLAKTGFVVVRIRGRQGRVGTRRLE